MREILFRGKTEKNDNWVYGSLNNTDHQFPEIMYCDKNWSVCSTSIKPETIGQYTGLTDKNGTKIFEGDIVKRKDKILYVIRYIYGGFDSEPINEFYKEPKITWNTLGEMQNALWCMDNCEVIGNIYDNKELLEEI